MNFNLDDPLGDLLSDNSNDNDSFFESQPGRKKIVSKSPAKKSAVGKGKMEDLFGIKEESEPEFKVPALKTSVIGDTKADKPLASSTPKGKAKADENDDILSELGFDPKKPKSSSTTKVSLFDDILGSIETKKPAPIQNSKLDELNVRRDDTSASIRGTISRQSTDTTENSGILGQSRPKTSTGRRSLVASPTKNNPLDLFTAPKGKETSRNITVNVRKRGTPADWLGLGTESEEEPAKTELDKRPETPVSKAVEQSTTESSNIQALNVGSSTPATMLEVMPNPNPFLITSQNLANQNVVQIVKQQENHIALAAQMKNQEAALLDMQKRQQDLLSRQESQFNELLQKQIARQNHLEQTIRAQQDRINTHIQLLMTQPINMDIPDSTVDAKPQNSPNKRNELIELEADLKRLELEKLRLEDLVSNINANYEKEIEMIEKSFRKQMKVLEDHLESVETRLQKEIEDLHRFYTDKLNSSENEKLEIKTRLETNLTTLRQVQEEELQKLKKTHEIDLDILRDDHRRMLKTIRQSKLLEFAAVQENGSYIETLRMATSNLENASGDLQVMRLEMERKLDVFQRERESKLEAREKKIEDAERRLKMTEETAEDEKRRLMDLVASLEIQLTTLSRESSEENWIIRQKMASLEAEKTAFEREKALAREQIMKDEKRIEELKQLQLNETQRQMQLIQDERTQLNIDKAKHETSKKLESGTENERLRLEMEASLKVAQDATRQAEMERERYFKLQRQLEHQKRQFIDKENNIRSKEEELEQEISLTRAKQRRAHEAAQQARLSEQNFNEKTTFLQQKMHDLGKKESSLSQERLVLSQERIELQHFKTKMEQNKCSLCRIGERNRDLTHVLRPTNGSTLIPVVDDQQYPAMRNSDTVDVDRLLDENVEESLMRMKENNLHLYSDSDVRRVTSNNDLKFDINFNDL